MNDLIQDASFFENKAGDPVQILMARLSAVLRTGAFLCAPKYWGCTARNLAFFLKVQTNSNARQTFSASFDRDFYYRSYPDVRASGIPPALHYSLRGFLEGRFPS